MAKLMPLGQWLPYLLPREWFALVGPVVLRVALALVVGPGLIRLQHLKS